VDEQKAYALARQLANNEYKRNPDMLNMLAWSIVEDNPQRTLKSPDYALAVEIAQRAVQLTNEKDPFILDTLAYALFKQGKVEEAIRYQEKAVALLKERKDVPDEIRREIEERLEKFRKAAQ
jgi:tetratricopeptide (TPR) repeat protein